MERKHRIALIILFAVAVAARITFSLSAGHFMPDAYFSLRQAEHIAANGTPIIDDALSFGGRHLFVPLLFYYILAFFSFFADLSFVAHIIPQILMALMVFIIYATVHKITKDTEASFMAAFLSAGIPIIFTSSLFSVQVSSLAAPLVFLALYAVMNIRSAMFTLIFIGSVIALTLTSPSGMFLVLGLVIYLVISLFERLRLDRAEAELIFFSFFIFLWAQFLIYKDALLMHGIGALWQNIPSALILSQQVAVEDVLLQVGILPLTGGAYVFYKYLFKRKNKPVYIYTGVAMVGIFAALLRLASAKTFLLYFGLSLSVMFGVWYSNAKNYFMKTRLAQHRWLYAGGAILLIMVTAFLPAITGAVDARESVTPDKVITALHWLGNRTAQDAVVLAHPDEGQLVAAVAKRANIIDSNFLLVRHAEKRLADAEMMFKTQLPTVAVELLNLYGADYIVLTDYTRQRYNISALGYENERCLRQIYADGVTIYRSTCRLEVIT